MARECIARHSRGIAQIVMYRLCTGVYCLGRVQQIRVSATRSQVMQCIGAGWLGKAEVMFSIAMFRQGEVAFGCGNAISRNVMSWQRAGKRCFGYARKCQVVQRLSWDR